jgi:hypothetical protein
MQLVVQSLSQTVNFKHRFKPQRTERFSNASQRRAAIGRKKADVELPFEHGEVITLWMVYQYTQSLQKFRRTS